MFKLKTKDVVHEKTMICPDVDTEYPGLAYICTLDQLIVVEKLDALHKVIGKHTSGYTIYNKSGEKVFLAVKDDECGKFAIKIFNFYGNEVIQVDNPRKLFIKDVLVWAPPGHFVGSIVKVKCFGHDYLVKDSAGRTVLKIKAQKLCKFIYDITSDGEIIGTIMGNWEVKGVDGDNFGVAFPVNIGLEEKATLLGACFLIGCLKLRNKCC